MKKNNTLQKNKNPLRKTAIEKQDWNEFLISTSQASGDFMTGGKQPLDSDVREKIFQ